MHKIILSNYPILVQIYIDSHVMHIIYIRLGRLRGIRAPSTCVICLRWRRRSGRGAVVLLSLDATAGKGGAGWGIGQREEETIARHLLHTTSSSSSSIYPFKRRRASTEKRSNGPRTSRFMRNVHAHVRCTRHRRFPFYSFSFSPLVLRDLEGPRTDRFWSGANK